ncbi:MAG: biotin--[acetyl-CoA-carboxylase] ligase [Bdellovibrionota bacterium]|nr:biotin--[acetyl-CoA-carboxylase] ligase [Bdellovibrionota bacterium]
MLGQEIFEQAKSSGISVEYSEKIGSTNDWAKESQWGSTKIFTCDQQNAGRGRFERTWADSETGGQIFISYCKLLSKAPHFLLAPLIGLQLKDFFKSNFPKNDSYFLKLPNDIYLNDKKICGILCEMQQQQDQFRLIIGMGINFFTHPQLESSGALFDSPKSLPKNFVQNLINQLEATDWHLERTKPNECFLSEVILQRNEAVVDISPEFDFISNQRKVNWRDL